MSRRRGEFEHRTSIFEGAFRAWSHLGGLEPEDLENKSSADLDPLSHPIENDINEMAAMATTVRWKLAIIMAPIPSLEGGVYQSPVL